MYRTKNILLNSKAYYRDADCVICMYDVTCEKSFHNLKNWIASIKDIKDNTTIKIVIIGTKVDLIENTNLKTVQTKEAEAFAEVNYGILI
jgi:GTPase SAR1 family protein